MPCCRGFRPQGVLLAQHNLVRVHPLRKLCESHGAWVQYLSGDLALLAAAAFAASGATISASSTAVSSNCAPTDATRADCIHSTGWQRSVPGPTAPYDAWRHFRLRYSTLPARSCHQPPAMLHDIRRGRGMLLVPTVRVQHRLWLHAVLSHLSLLTAATAAPMAFATTATALTVRSVVSAISSHCAPTDATRADCIHSTGWQRSVPGTTAPYDAWRQFRLRCSTLPARSCHQPPAMLHAQCNDGCMLPVPTVRVHHRLWLRTICSVMVLFAAATAATAATTPSTLTAICPTGFTAASATSATTIASNAAAPTSDAPTSAATTSAATGMSTKASPPPLSACTPRAIHTSARRPERSVRRPICGWHWREQEWLHVSRSGLAVPLFRLW